MLAVAPVTGRTHQIRVHAAHAGRASPRRSRVRRAVAPHLPAGRVLEPGRIALHARASWSRKARTAAARPRSSPVPAGAGIPLVRAWRRPRRVGGCRVVRALLIFRRRSPAPPRRSRALGARRRAAALAIDDDARARRGRSRSAAPDIAITQDAPGPAAAGRALAVGLRPCAGTAATSGSSAFTRSSCPQPQATPRVMGRFALELFEGPDPHRAGPLRLPAAREPTSGRRTRPHPPSRASCERASASSSPRPSEARVSSCGTARPAAAGRCLGHPSRPDDTAEPNRDGGRSRLILSPCAV
jgi:hypothetical protein